MSKTKDYFHPKNIFNKAYDFEKLCEVESDLKVYLTKNKTGHTTIDFQNADAVKALNKALLKLHFNIDFWDIPKGYLIPPIPGRLDYLHYIADVIEECKSHLGEPFQSNTILDIGTGAGIIYPILGVRSYNWSFMGIDIDPQAIKVGKAIAESNNLSDRIKLRLQSKPDRIFKNVITTETRILASICNPPFYEDMQHADSHHQRKNRNLSIKTEDRNFKGKDHELITKGGEYGFISRMIEESELFKDNILVFSSLISQKSSVDPLVKKLEKIGPGFIKIIPMQHGNKTSRILAWCY